MLSQEQREQFRGMTPGERMALSLELTRQFEERLMKKPQRIIDRFFRMWHHENDMRSKNLLEAFARLKAREEDRDRRSFQDD